VHFAEAQNLHSRPERPPRPALLLHGIGRRRASRWLLRAQRPDTHQERSAEQSQHPRAFHFFFSSSVPNSGNPAAETHSVVCGNRNAFGCPSSPTSKSTCIKSAARSSFTVNPSALRAPRCICTRTTVASSSIPGKLPGKTVKSPASLAATIVSPNSGPAGVVLFMFTACAEFTPDGVLPFLFSCRQLTQLTAAKTTAAAASAQPANTAARCAFTVLCRVRNSCRSRISTRAGASASCVSAPTACKSARNVCQFSCNAAQRAHERRCSRAALSTGSSSCIVCRSSPASSNSSHVIAASPAKLSPARARALRCVPQHLQLRQQERPPAVQPRTNRAHWTIQQPRRFVVTQFFQPAQHHRFAKLHGQLQYRCANLFPPLANFRPLGRRHRLKCLASLPYGIFVEFFVQQFPRRPLQMFHHAIARNAIQKRPQCAPLRIELFRLSNQG